ncbi:cellulase domain-containing protein [Haematococcus lacustris]|uniref:Cellulase domain-containing protein n=1 Tax=Haematococcus lacustris TaxID=44745 RepID=A0A699YCQ7_HAELA|nr:cellulase domain-containing protein [Haematococcus lacustris]
MGRLLANSKASGGGLAGALLWNGADNNTADQDGYNVRIDRWPSALIEAPPALKSLPNVMSYLRTFVNPGATKPGSVTAEMKQWEALDIQAFQNEAWPAEEVDILKWTSDQVN